ncbi:FusB/FusC family EF-G-binding protein [Salinibacillus xinjiangensis]|uniref:Elongation factor G-binding protein n=1 Tax=Salinibacillus xinjiangensis TaxID=1229268 RepID=A0A6G1X849_9BACI|nr:FusB/FusC family EF-G-binding protein [Salinibacillus xinjiangensis]MRG87181.1 elongation factor G-binding protein [Salinibacillus xinjiangensis]
MESFIRVDQYNFIKSQAQALINGHATAKDEDVLDALKSLVIEKITKAFEELTTEQEDLINPIVNIEDKEQGELFVAELKPYVIPFNATEQGIQKLFPKVKKLKVPSLDELDLKEVTYLSWIDHSANKKFIVTRLKGKLVGIQGSFETTSHKGFCAICNGHESVSMFLAKEKGKVQGTFTKRGNYICRDSEVCNQNLTSLDKLQEFIERLTK